MTPRNGFRNWVNAKLQPEYLLVVAVAVVVLSLVMSVAMFVTSNEGRTAFGIPLGADFSGFYVAAQILNRGQADRLYDRQLHTKMYHELFPFEDERAAIPYVHPPFVAGLLQPLAALPYRYAVGVWMLISISVYLASIWLLFTARPWLNRRQQWLVLALALAFEPFAFECWLGGQLSAMGSFGFALCFALTQRGRRFAAGMALGLCFYKPTLLILVLPMLLIGRRWQELGGMTISGLLLAGLSWWFVGWENSLGYMKELLSFSRSTSGGDLDIRTWKYVDLNNAIRLVMGTQSSFVKPILLVIGIFPIANLSRFWWNIDRFDQEYRRQVWAATLSWLPLLNLYVGIYDSVLVVHSLYISAAAVVALSNDRNPLIGSQFAYFALMLGIAPWMNQFLAAHFRIPCYSLVLIAFGLWQIRRLRMMYSISRLNSDRTVRVP